MRYEVASDTVGVDASAFEVADIIKERLENGWKFVCTTSNAIIATLHWAKEDEEDQTI